MFVIIMSAKICWRIDFVEYHNVMICIKMKEYMDSRDEWSTGKITVHYRKVVGALRVPPAVTRLTVDRRHPVRRAPTASLKKLQLVQ